MKQSSTSALITKRHYASSEFKVFIRSTYSVKLLITFSTYGLYAVATPYYVRLHIFYFVRKNKLLKVSLFGIQILAFKY